MASVNQTTYCLSHLHPTAADCGNCGKTRQSAAVPQSLYLYRDRHGLRHRGTARCQRSTRWAHQTRIVKHLRSGAASQQWPFVKCGKSERPTGRGAPRNPQGWGFRVGTPPRRATGDGRRLHSRELKFGNCNAVRFCRDTRAENTPVGGGGGFELMGTPAMQPHVDARASHRSAKPLQIFAHFDLALNSK